MKRFSTVLFVFALFSALNPIKGFSRGWITENNVWKYQDYDGSFARNTWKWIDGNNDGSAECYYFLPNGTMYSNGTTPDGYTVNSKGAWTIDGQVQRRSGYWVNGIDKKWYFVKPDGNRAVNEWQLIDSDYDGVAEYYYFQNDGTLLVDGIAPDGRKINKNGQALDGENAVIKTVVPVDITRRSEEEHNKKRSRSSGPDRSPDYSNSKNDKSGKCGKNLTYKITGSGDDLTLTISGTGHFYEYELLETRISPLWKKYSDKIRHLVLNEGMTAITRVVFKGMDHIEGEIVIPSTVEEIEGASFRECKKISKVIIPDSVKKIGGSAFENCTGLNSVDISSPIEYFGLRVFYGCKNLTGTIVVPDNFYFRNDKSNPFYRTKLQIVRNGEIIYDGEENENWENNAYSGFCGDYITYKVSGNDGDLKLKLMGSGSVYSFDKVYESPWGDIKDGITSIEFDNKIYGIASNDFKDFSNLENVDLPSSLEYIGKYAFAGCHKISFVDFPEKLQRIGISAFDDCTGLTGELSIPDSVTSISSHAFRNCTSLTKVELSSKTDVDRDAFEGCDCEIVYRDKETDENSSNDSTETGKDSNSKENKVSFKEFSEHDSTTDSIEGDGSDMESDKTNHDVQDVLAGNKLNIASPSEISEK